MVSKDISFFRGARFMKYAAFMFRKTDKYINIKNRLSVETTSGSANRQKNKDEYRVPGVDLAKYNTANVKNNAKLIGFSSVETVRTSGIPGIPSTRLLALSPYSTARISLLAISRYPIVITVSRLISRAREKILSIFSCEISFVLHRR